mgnify:CR=1 FL=1
MTKRGVIISIIALILLILATVGVLWQRSRKIAVQNGRTAPTFREFIGLGGKGTRQTGANGELSSDFTDTTSSTTSTPMNSDGSFGDNINTGGGQVLTSNFTSDTITPLGDSNLSGGISIGGMPGSGTSSGGGTTTTTTSGTASNPGTGGSGTTPTTLGAGCSEADTNIAFTDQERADLDRLRARFERIASRLHNSADANQERDNFDEYNYTVKRATELTAWCQTKAPIFTQPELKVKVATPFWHEAGDMLRYFFTPLPTRLNACRSSDGWFHFHGSSRDGYSCNSNGFAAPADFIIEDSLRLNLW